MSITIHGKVPVTHSARRKTPVLPFVWRGLLPLALLCLLAAYALGDFARRSIESSVLEQTRAVLAAEGFPWAGVSVSGQEVVISGAPPTAGDGARALASARTATCTTWAGPLPCAVDVTANFTTAIGQEPPVTLTDAAAGPRLAQLCEQTLADLISASTIEFATASDALRASSGELLDAIAVAVRNCPAVIRIEGHTDASGSTTTNRLLSEARAVAVREALIARGIDQERLVAEGFGAEEAIADNQTVAGRAKNRRIEFHVDSTDLP